MKTTIILLILSFIIVLFGFFAQVFSLQESEYVWITKEQVKNLLWNLQEIKLAMREIAKGGIDDEASNSASYLSLRKL